MLGFKDTGVAALLPGVDAHVPEAKRALNPKP